MTENIAPALSLERIRQARETLTEAFRLTLHGEFLGAVQAMGAFAEARRNLTALVAVLYGRDAWQRIVDED